MKKIISFALVALLMIAMACNVTAAELTTATGISGNTSGDVEIAIVPKDDPATPGDEGTTYSVAIAWETMKFTYTGTWDPEELAFTGTWDKTSANITVTNSSNAAVNVDAYFDTLGTTSATQNGVTANLTHYDFLLNSAADNGSAQSGNITVSIIGAPEVSGGFKVGTVTVAISTVD